MRAPRLFTDLSIRTKLIVLVAGTLVLAQTISSLLVHDVVSRHIMQQAITTAEILTTSIQHDITYETQRDPQSDGQQIIAKYMTYYRIISDMAIYNANRERVASSDPSLLRRRTTDPEVVAAIVRAKPTLHVSRPDIQDLGIRSVVPILQGSRIVGAVAIDVSMRDVKATLDALDRRIMLIAGAKLLVVCVVLFVLLRVSILVRLGRLIATTREITAGNYHARVADTQRDEIGVLARAFDQMTSDLLASRRELDDYNRQLERRVGEATAELQQAYQDLKNAQSQLVMNEKMATLGVLVAGVTHEINTPSGAILNVSRNLEKQIQTLPEHLAAFKRDPDIPVDDMVACLRALIASSCTARPSASLKVQKAVEALLHDHGVADGRARAASLCKLNFTDPAEIVRYIGCLRIPSFFSFAETFASIAQAANISQTSANKITEIIRALKYYAYSDADRVEMVQVNESIATALVLLDHHLKHKVTVHTDYGVDLPRIPCASDLHQVWTNLLTNASDAIAERSDGVPGEIRVVTRHEGESVVVTITDNGVGIPPDVQHRIFDPFFTTKDIGKGTGLGLSIVSGILGKHGATIQVSSRPGRTCFEVALPVSGRLASESRSAPDAAAARPAERVASADAVQSAA